MLKIVLTGISSSGKTTVINNVVERFTEQGYRVFVVPETATELILSGVSPAGKNSIDPAFFQEIVLKKQLAKEKLYESIANTLGNDNVIILFDRGTLDGYAYVETSAMQSVVDKLHLNKRSLLSNYDAVLFLEGAPEFFTKENNPARYEADADAASSLRPKLLAAYLGHDNIHIIRPREDIKDKKDEVTNIIANMLGKPTRIKIQQKFLVEDIDTSLLNNMASKVDITQDYLSLNGDLECRVRKMTQNGETSYHLSVMQKGENGKRTIIKEDVISLSEYNNLLLFKNPKLQTIEKTRYSFVYANQYYKLDIFADGLIILEVNLTKENPEMTLPEFIKVSDDVTNNPEYNNFNIANRKESEYEKGETNCNRGHRLLRERNTIETAC